MARPKKQAPQEMAENQTYITDKEMDRIITDIISIMSSAKEVQTVVNNCVGYINKQDAEPGSDIAMELYKCKQESYFAQLHADSVVDSLDYLKRKLTRMQQIYTIEKNLERKIKKELIAKHNNKED